jgi:hypothetical protein
MAASRYNPASNAAAALITETLPFRVCKSVATLAARPRNGRRNLVPGASSAEHALDDRSRQPRGEVLLKIVPVLAITYIAVDIVFDVIGFMSDRRLASSACSSSCSSSCTSSTTSDRREAKPTLSPDGFSPAVSVFSVNVPVPPAVSRLASGLASETFDADVRTRHSLVAKRLGDEYRVSKRVREALRGTGPFRVRVHGVDAFEVPTSGRAPVAYLDVESPGIWELHRTLCEVVDPIPELEGDDYTPHVTIARGGDCGKLVGRDAGPIEWTVERLEFYDSRHRETVESVSLPA